MAFSIPEIAVNLGLAYQFNELTLTNKLFTLLIILAIWPLESALVSLINKFKEKSKKSQLDI